MRKEYRSWKIEALYSFNRLLDVMEETGFVKDPGKLKELKEKWESSQDRISEINKILR